MSMNDSVQVNQVYLIFNRPLFLVDISETFHIIPFLLFLPFRAEILQRLTSDEKFL